MEDIRTRSSWPGLAALCAIVLLVVSSCASVSKVTVVPAGATISADDDYEQLVAQVSTDMSRYGAREAARAQLLASTQARLSDDQRSRIRENEFSARAKALFAPLSGRQLSIPVVGVYASSLDDSWHAPRDGGVRQHKGIDIFAPKGTPIIAVEDGIVSFIGDEPKGGHCVWLTSDEGTSFYYAHLDHWAPGLYEGLDVRRGEILGYVGNTGNARNTPSHLHFGINQNDEMVNPFPLLVRAVAVPVSQAHLHTASAGGTSRGSR